MKRPLTPARLPTATHIGVEFAFLRSLVGGVAHFEAIDAEIRFVPP
jgi:hypothetical protein